MKSTKLDRSLTNGFKELKQIIGRAFVLDEFLREATMRIERDIDMGLVPEMFMSTGVLIRDITIPQQSGVHNLYQPPIPYKVTWTNYKDEAEVIVSREHLFYVAQAYEILEGYLYNQVTELIVATATFHLFIDAKTNKTTFSSVRKALKTLDNRKNNRHLIRILRANCPVYSAHEKNNFYNLDFEEWFDILGTVRHCITHNRMVLDKDTMNTLPKSFIKAFGVRDYDGTNQLFVTHDQAMQQILRIAEFMFFIYKAIYQTCYSEQVDFIHLDGLFS